MLIVDASITHEAGYPEAIITRVGNQRGRAFIRVFPQGYGEDIHTMPYLSISMKANTMSCLLVIRSHSHQLPLSQYDRVQVHFIDGTYTELQVTEAFPIGAVMWSWASVYNDQLAAIATHQVSHIVHYQRYGQPVIHEFLPNETYATKKEGRTILPLMAQRLIGCMDIMKGATDYARLS